MSAVSHNLVLIQKYSQIVHTTARGMTQQYRNSAQEWHTHVCWHRSRPNRVKNPTEPFKPSSLEESRGHAQDVGIAGKMFQIHTHTHAPKSNARPIYSPLTGCNPIKTLVSSGSGLAPGATLRRGVLPTLGGPVPRQRRPGFRRFGEDVDAA